MSKPRIEKASDVHGGQYVPHNPAYNSGYEDGKKAGKEYCASEIAELRDQVATLTKERDIKEHCIVQLEAEDLRMKGQLAALAEQVEKMREALAKLEEAARCVQAGEWDRQSINPERMVAKEAISLPDLATPVLNKYRTNELEAGVA